MFLGAVSCRKVTRKYMVDNGCLVICYADSVSSDESEIFHLSAL